MSADHARTPDTYWTEARVETMRRMVGEGASMREIADALGCKNKNAVAGKMHRLGLTIAPRATRNAGVNPGTTAAQSRKERIAREKKPVQEIVAMAERSRARARSAHERMTGNERREAIKHADPGGHFNKPFLERRWNECATIIGEVRHPAICCGAPIMFDSADEPPYCRYHFARHTATFGALDKEKTPRFKLGGLPHERTAPVDPEDLAALDLEREAKEAELAEAEEADPELVPVDD